LRVVGIWPVKDLQRDAIFLQLFASASNCLFNHVGEKAAEPLRAHKKLTFDNPP
jgi:hypothetical protein